jgi:hypothetical protein
MRRLWEHPSSPNARFQVLQLHLAAMLRLPRLLLLAGGFCYGLISFPPANPTGRIHAGSTTKHETLSKHTESCPGPRYREARQGSPLFNCRLRITGSMTALLLRLIKT